jgi:hypothetical protein
MAMKARREFMKEKGSKKDTCVMKQTAEAQGNTICTGDEES